MDDPCDHPNKPDCSTCGTNNQNLCVGGSCKAKTCGFTPDPIIGCPGSMVTVPMTVSCSPAACDATLTIEGPVPTRQGWSISGTGNCTAGSGSGTLTVTIPTSATPGSQSFGVLVKLNNKVCSAASVVVTVDECVGLSIAGVSDVKEADPGGFICLNDDDDNGNGVPDKDEAGATLAENDLKALTVTIKPGLTGTVMLPVPSARSAQAAYAYQFNNVEWDMLCELRSGLRAG